MQVDQSLVCYILDQNTGSKINFNIEKPEGYSDSYRANFTPQDVRGRSSPFQSYVNSGPRSVSFSVLLSLDYNRNLASLTEDMRNMFRPYLVGSTGDMVKPPRVSVVIGTALKISAIPVSFGAEWSGGYKEGVFRLCTWSFEFTAVEGLNYYNTGKKGETFAEIPLGVGNITVLESGKDKSGSASEVGSVIKLSEGEGFISFNGAINHSGGKDKIEEGEYEIKEVKYNAIRVHKTDGSGRDLWIEKS